MDAHCETECSFSTSLVGILKQTLCQNHLQVLKSFRTSLLWDQEYREGVEEDIFVSLLKILSRLHEELEDQGGQCVPLYLQLTAECFRATRNACVQSHRNQDLLRELGFIEASLKILSLLLTQESSDSLSEPLGCGIQFLGNLSVGNQVCKDHIWQQTFPAILQQLLSVDVEKVVGFASMVLHNCLDEAKVEQLTQPQNLHLALRVMELCRTQPDQEWPLLIATQHFLRSSALVKSMYTRMSPLERVTLLELLSAHLLEEDSEECGTPPDVARFLACCFQNSCGVVLTLAGGSATSDEALTVIALLDVLCEMTSDRRRFMFLQKHPGLLQATVELLQKVHALGKASKNVFSAARNFSFSQSGDTSSSNPSISFKAHLIRLIGNLCHGNVSNQNKVRELEGIPLILDNCGVDSNNPFISQWAIFAIRNLLEQNPENQELVSGLERRGAADYSALLDLGFQVEERDGTLLLKPVKKDS